MKVPKSVQLRAKYVARWLTGAGIPNLTADHHTQTITGLRGIKVTVGNLRKSGGYVATDLMQAAWVDRKWIHVMPPPPSAGEIQDSIVLVRLDFMADLLEAYIERHADRVVGKE